MATKILKNTIYYTIGEIVPRFLSFILLPILTIYLTAEEYGINSYLTAVMSFVLIFSSLSLNTFFLRNYFSANEIGKKEMIGSIFLFIFFFNILLSVMQMFGFPLIISYLEINIPFYPYFFLIIIIYFFESTSIIPLLIYRVKDNAKGFLVVNLSKTVLQFLVVYAFVVVLKHGLEGSLQARLLVNIPFFFIYFYIIWKNGIFKLDFNIIKQGLRFSLPLLPGALSFLLISLSDRIIMERYIGLDEIGIFSVAATLCLLLNVISQALYKSFEPIIFKEFYEKEFKKTNVKLFKIYLFALFLGAFCISIFSKEFFLIATSGVFKSGYKIVPYLIVSVVISGINTYYGLLLIANKKMKLYSFAFILNAIINVVLNFLLVPSFGYYGAILASVISFLISNLIFQYNVVIENKFLWSQLILMVSITFAPIFLDNYIHLSVFLSIIIKIILCLIFIVMACFLLKINYNELKQKLLKK